MRRFLNAVKAGLKGAKETYEPGRYDVVGKPVKCQHCDGQEFAVAKVLLNTTAMTIVGMDWADKKATTLVCTRFGCIQWFVTATKKETT